MEYWSTGVMEYWSIGVAAPEAGRTRSPFEALAEEGDRNRASWSQGLPKGSRLSVVTGAVVRPSA